jgi:hypothetical protein
LQQAASHPAQVAVIVRGVDSHGYPFMQTAQAIRFSRTSVELAGIDCLNGAADVVTLECNRRRCRYRVAWIGCDKDGRAGHARLESLDPISFIFDSENELLSDPLHLSVPEAPKPISVKNVAISRTQTERRRYERYSWGANAQVRKKGVPANTLCKVTDISLGGCYIELMMPFPEGTPIELDLFWQDRKLTLDARVATSHPAIGMGVSFFGFAEDQYRLLQQLIENLSGKHTTPPTEAVNSVNPAALTQELFDWFDQHNVLSRDQFEQLVQKQKPKNVSSASPAMNTGTC